MRILMLINGLYPETMGGIEKIGAELAGHLAKNHDVMVYTSYERDLPADEIRNNYSIKRIKSSNDLKLRLPLGIKTINILRQLKREEEKPDIILSMSLGYSVIAYLAKKCFGIPFLVYVLGSDWYIARNKRIKGQAFKLGIRKCNTLITQTNIIKSDISRYFADKEIETVPNGITIPKKASSGDKIVYLGRLHKIKGIEYLIQAMGKVKDCPELIIAGSGPEEDRLRRMARGLNVRFTGRVSNVEDVLMQGRLLVLPSLSEGLPQVILEAMSFGLPVIATKVGGIPEVIEHGETGFLVEPRNPGEIGKFIEILLRDEDLHSRMRENCLVEVKKYSWDNIMKRIESVIQKCVASARENAGTPRSRDQLHHG